MEIIKKSWLQGEGEWRKIEKNRKAENDSGARVG